MKFNFIFLFFIYSASIFGISNSDKVEIARAIGQITGAYKSFYYEGPNDDFYYEKVAEDNEKLLPFYKGTGFGPFRLQLKDIKPKTEFNIYQFNLLEKNNPKLLCSGKVDSNGEAWINLDDHDMKLAHYIQFIRHVYPGEPIYSLVTLNDEKKSYIATCVVPIPMQASGLNGRHIRMELYTVEEAGYLVLGKCFKPKEKVRMMNHSKYGTVEDNFEAKEDGTFLVLLKGNLIQKYDEEKEYIEITTSEQTEPLRLEFDWKFLNKGMDRFDYEFK